MIDKDHIRETRAKHLAYLVLTRDPEFVVQQPPSGDPAFLVSVRAEKHATPLFAVEVRAFSQHLSPQLVAKSVKNVRERARKATIHTPTIPVCLFLFFADDEGYYLWADDPAEHGVYPPRKLTDDAMHTIVTEAMARPTHAAAPSYAAQSADRLAG